VSIQFTLLNERRRDQGPFGLSLILHTGAVILAILVPLVSPEIALPQHHYQVVTLYTPQPYKASPVKVDLPKPKPLLVKQVPKIELPRHRTEMRELRAPQVAFNHPREELMPAARATMPRLVPSVKVGVLTGSSAPATVKAPLRKVQTGGFGDENGVNPSPKSDGRGHLVVARLGSFDLPPVPVMATDPAGRMASAGRSRAAALATVSPAPDKAAARAAVPTAAWCARGDLPMPLPSRLPMPVRWQPNPSWSQWRSFPNPTPFTPRKRAT
jgi:hypothetical protein